MAEMLPDNLLLDVFSRLPVKTIIYCKCVCKKWRGIVSDPYFVRLHLSRSREALMMNQDISSSHKLGNLTWMEIKYEEADYHVRPVKGLNLKRCGPGRVPLFRLLSIGSVNGLVCCARRHEGVYIFDPVFEEYMALPTAPLRLWPVCFGFGISSDGEYKVIWVSNDRESRIDTHPVEIEVYTLGTDQWRVLGQTHLNLRSTSDLCSLRQNPGAGVFLNNHVYWLLGNKIFYFDLTTETFELFSFPPDHGVKTRMLGVLKGRLSCISWCLPGLEVSVMKGGSWYKQITIQETIWCRPLCLIDGLEGTGILLLYAVNKLLKYCLKTNTILDQDFSGRCPEIMTYCPSFVSLRNFGSDRVHSMYNNNMG